jgi:hypothetical protein
MKNLIILLSIAFTTSINAQIDLSMETSVIGFETTPVVDILVPVKKVTLGASLGYYIHPKDYKERLTGIAGYNILENVTMEATFGVIKAFDEYHFTGSLGAKTIFNNNLFVKGAISYPGLIRASLGYRINYK